MPNTPWEDIAAVDTADRRARSPLKAAIDSLAPEDARLRPAAGGGLSATTLANLVDLHPAADASRTNSAIVDFASHAPALRPTIHGGFEVLADLSHVLFDLDRDLNVDALLEIAFGADKASVMTRTALLGRDAGLKPFEPTAPGIPAGMEDFLLDPSTMAMLALRGAVMEVIRAALTSNIGGFNDWVGRAQAHANGIEQVEPFVVCGGQRLTIRGNFPTGSSPRSAPDFTTVRVPTSTGCEEAEILSWSDLEITVRAPMNVAPGAVGFLVTDGDPPPASPSDFTQAAAALAGVLGDFELMGTTLGAAAATSWSNVANDPPLKGFPCPQLLPKTRRSPRSANEIHGGPPQIRAFLCSGSSPGEPTSPLALTCDVRPGDSAELSWEVTGVDEISIEAVPLPRHPLDPMHELPGIAGPQPPSGTHSVGPLPMSTMDDWRGAYRITATNTCGTTQASVTVEMREHPPLFGIADTHVHFTAHLASGGFAIWGKPHPADPKTTGDAALRECLPPCDDGVTGHGPGGLIPGLEGVGHLVGGAWGNEMAFDGWPKHTTLGHQQTFIDWIKRAHDGGLRLAVCLVNNSELLAGMGDETHPGPMPLPATDMGTVPLQLDAMKALVKFVKDQTPTGQVPWLVIVKTPAQARTAVENGQLALVMGVEVDSLGGWRTPQQLTSAATAAGVTPQQLIDGMLDGLFAEGVRHIFPLHGTNNAFGGAALFQAVYDPANFRSTGTSFDVEPAPASLKIAWRLDEAVFDFAKVKMTAVLAGMYFGLLSGIAAAATTLGAPVRVLSNNLTPATVNWSDPSIGGTPNDNGHINAQGATAHMPLLLHSLMKRGMLIDIDHMGHKTTQSVLAEVEKPQHRYPVVSGHTQFRELKHGAAAAARGLRWKQTDGPALNATDAEFGTRNPNSLASEVDKTPDVLSRIRALGGLVSPILIQRDMGDCECGNGYVANNNFGSSRSFAQALQYAVHHLRGRGIALGSDINGAAPMPSPRFGPNGAFYLQEDADRVVANAAGVTRRDQVLSQEQGVQYATPMREYRDSRFPHSDNGQLKHPFDAEERDFWEAMASVASGVRPDKIDQELIRPVWTRNFITDLAWGIRANSRGDLQNSQNEVQIAGLLIVHPNEPELASDSGNTKRLTAKLRPIFNHWTKMQSDHLQSLPRPLWGRNLPLYVNNKLTRSVAGRRDFDINIDGMAHYGLLPDLVQDLHNVGADVDVLYRSANDYIQTWERCVARSTDIP